jgi:hypothetical protein
MIFLAGRGGSQTRTAIPQRRLHVYRPLLVFLLAILALVALALFVTSVIGQQSSFVPGDASRFDPVAAYPQVVQRAGDGAHLITLEARFVHPDGTLDLYAPYKPAPTVTYRFYRDLATAPSDAPPLGAGGLPDGRWYEPVTISISRPIQWQYATTTGGIYPFINLGMKRSPSPARSTPSGKAAPDPTCAFADFWKAAVQQGAPTNAVAIIMYDVNGYEFHIDDTPVDLRFGQDCQLR